ncbi:MAG: DUF4336 domain-containing protein [Pseudomonadales bacterium]
MITEIGLDIWTMEGPELVFAGAEMGTRMTIVKLASGDLWVHSPVALDAATIEYLTLLGGPVRHLVAPNRFHHLFLSQWRERWPSAVVYAESGLLKKIPAIEPALTLSNDAPPAYRADIEQILFDCNPFFSEAIFFHRPSATLILTDLFINLCVDHVPLLPRLFLRFEQVIYPHGGMPRLLRWTTRDKVRARTVFQQLLDWQPRQITFAHGQPLAGSPEEIIHQQFDWV